MNFSKESSDLMRFFIDNFHKISTNKSSTKQINTDKLLSIIYDDIKISSRAMEIIMNSEQYNKKQIFVNSNTKLPSTNLLDSSFVPESIKSKITNVKKYIEINCKIFNKNIKIFMFLFNNDNIDKYNIYIKNILIVIRVLLLYANEKSGSLSIYLYLSEETKDLPTNSLKILSKENCNSAVTTACDNNGSILIYRKEEWFKVLIHELFHNLCLDLNGIHHGNIKKKFIELFNIKTDMEISESYAEFWATIINCCFCSYYLLDDPCDKKSFLLYVEFCIEFERTFSLFQVIKVLDFMGLNYSELISNNNENKILKTTLYREKTNVFTYYILKMILLYDYDNFLSWCYENNNLLLKFRKSPKNVLSFYNFVLSTYKTKTLIKKLVKNGELMAMYKKLKGGYKFPYKEKILKTMRMTICELKLN